MRVMGIDPGIAITGIAFIDEVRGINSLAYCQAIETDSHQPTAKRLSFIYNQIKSLITKYNPVTAALESLFFNTNAKTALTVGQARGVIQLAIENESLPISEYSPLEVKMAITGYGRADKNQIQHMVKNILKLQEILSPDDVADAAAIALTHCFSHKLRDLH